MGLFKWLQKRGLAGLIPRNAYEQYIKWQASDPSLSEAEIAQGIFVLRYVTGNPILNLEEEFRLRCYINSEFECESLMGFCLVSLDIEGHISPSDGKAFRNTYETIIEELERLGFIARSNDVNHFVGKWKEQIYPYR